MNQLADQLPDGQRKTLAYAALDAALHGVVKEEARKDAEESRKKAAESREANRHAVEMVIVIILAIALIPLTVTKVVTVSQAFFAGMALLGLGSVPKLLRSRTGKASGGDSD